MAFDLIGENPKSYDGEWIKFNIWTWHRIWLGLQDLCPEETSSIKNWYTNSGELVPEEVAKKIGKSIQKYGDARFAKLAASKVDVDQMSNVGDRTIEAHILFEMEAFIAFLYSCGGFRIN